MVPGTEVHEGDRVPRPLQVPESLEFGARIRAARIAGDYTQEELGIALGTTLGYISDLEKGKGNPTFDTIMFLANTLNIDPGSLLQGLTYSAQRPRPARRRGPR